MSSPHNVAVNLELAEFPETGQIGEEDAGSLLGFGIAVPSGVAGFRPGALFMNTAGAVGARLFKNEGTLASCSFVEMADMSIADAGSYYATATVEAALQEIGQHHLSTKGRINLPIGSFLDGQGTELAMAIFASADVTFPGYTHLADEAVGLKWNNKGTLTPAVITVPKPPDLDDTAGMVMNIYAQRSATDAVDPAWTVTAFENVVGAAVNADSDFGGDSAVMADDVVVQKLTVALATANISSTEGFFTFGIQPKNGTLTTIDLTMIGAHVEYTRKFVTS